MCAIINTIYFQSSTKTKVDFPLYIDLYELCKKDELSCGFYLKEELLECSGQDRQDTRLAYQLFSDKTAALFRRFYSKDDESKMAAADYCDLSSKGRFPTYLVFCHLSLLSNCPILSNFVQLKSEEADLQGFEKQEMTNM